MKTKKAKLKGGIILSFAFALLICLTSAIFGIIGNSSSGYASAEDAAAVAQSDDGSGDARPADEGDGTEAHPYILWGDTLNKADIWVKALSDSRVTGKKVYVKLASNWVALPSDTFKTSFIGNDSSQHTGISGVHAFYYGNIQIAEGTSISFDLNGKTVSRNLSADNATQRGSVFYVYAGAMFELNDSTAVYDTDGSQTYSGDGKITGGASSNYSGGVFVESRGTFIMNAGNICGNYGYYGTVELYGNGASFIMNGGAIYNNSSVTGGGVYSGANSATYFVMNDGSIYGNTASGGSVFHVGYGTVTLNGGKIYENSSTNGSLFGVQNYLCNLEINDGVEIYNNQTYTGDGLISNLGQTVINGGKIYGNTVRGYGGIFDIRGQTVTINDCLIYENTISGTRVRGVVARVAGGHLIINGGKFFNNTSGTCSTGFICVNSGSTITMNGGQIYGNYLLSGSILESQGIITLNGGQIYGNGLANENQSVVVVTDNVAYTAELKVGGDFCIGYKKESNGALTKITNYRGGSLTKTGDYYIGSTESTVAALYVYGLTKVNINSALTGKIDVHFSYQGTFTGGFGANNSGKDPAQVFVPYNSEYEIISSGTGSSLEAVYRLKTNTQNYAAPPSWEDGRTRGDKNFVFDGDTFVLPLNICAGSRITKIERTAGGVTSDVTSSVATAKNGANTELTLKNGGKYVVTVGLDSGYAWNNTTDTTSTKTLTFWLRHALEVPLWTDGTNADRYFIYSGKDITVPYNVDDAVTVTSTNGGVVSNGAVTGNGAGKYVVTFTLPDTDSYCWVGGSTSAIGRAFLIRKEVSLPVFANGATSAYFTLNGGSGSTTFTNYSEGVKAVTVTPDGATVSGNTVTFTKTGTYTLTFGLTSTDSFVWEGGSTANRTLTLYVKNGYISVPKWADGTTGAKYLDSDGKQHTVSFVAPSNTTVSCDNENATIENGKFIAAAAGTYRLTFTLSEGYMWADGSNSASKTLTVYIAKVVQTPTWEDGTTGRKTFEYTGENLHILNIPEGVIVKSNYYGPKITDTEVTCSIAGNYTLTFSLKEGYVWRGGSVGDFSLYFQIAKSVSKPQWEDGSSESVKYLTYNGNEQGIAIVKDGTLNHFTVAITLTNGSQQLFVVPEGVAEYSVTYGDNTLRLEISETRIVLYGNNVGHYAVNIIASHGILIDGNEAAGGTVGLGFYITGDKSVAVPTWSDGTSAVYLKYDNGNALNFSAYDLPEGVKISSVSGNSNMGAGRAPAAVNGNVITAWDAGVYTVTFTLEDKTVYKWADNTYGNKTLTLYVIDYKDYPVWTDGTTANKYFKFTGSEQSVTLTVPEGLIITCSNSGAVITKGTVTNGKQQVTVSGTQIGTYTITFALPNTVQYRWTDTNSSANVTRTFYITGATEVERPTFEDGTTADKTFNFFGYSADKPLTFIVNVPEGATIAEVYNSDGINGSFVLNGDGTASVTLKAAGYYHIRFVIDEETYCWTDGTVANYKELIANVRYRFELPTWSDGTRTDKYISYNPDGVELEFNVASNVIIASCTNSNARIEGNKIYAVEPGVYTISFNVHEDTYNYGWVSGVSAGTTQTLTFYITGGTKVQAPSWDDGTTGTKYVTAGSGTNILTYKLPEGVTVSVSSNTSPATVSMVNGAAKINATAVGTYTVTFKITDTTKYVWSDNSASATKTLTLVVTSKTLVDIPTWADGTTEDKLVENNDEESNFGFLYIPGYADATLSSTASSNNIYLSGPEELCIVSGAGGEAILTFTLRDPSNTCWADGTTAPKTLKVVRTIFFDIPEWKDGGSENKYFEYNANGNSINIIYSFDNPYYFTYIDENGVNRGAMTAKYAGDGMGSATWSIICNGKTITLQFVAGSYNGNLQSATMKATAPGTYIFTQNLQGYPNDIGDVWVDGTQTTKTLTFTINPEGAEEVPVPEWADGGNEVLYIDYTGGYQTLFVKESDKYTVTAVSAPATFRGNEITFMGVGKYTITISLANVKDCVWEGGESGTKTLTFYVTGATEVAVPEWSDGTSSAKGFTYDGSARTVTVAELAEGAEVVSYSAGVTQNGLSFSAKGSSSGTSTYTITFGLTDATKYKWSDGTVGNKTLTFTIIAGNRVIIDTPEDKTVTYTGNNINVYLDDYFDGDLLVNGNITVTSITNGGHTDIITVTVKSAGTYIVTLHLKDSANTSYVWSNGSIDDYKWTITVEKGTVDTSKFVLGTYEGAYDGNAHPATLTGVPSWVTSTITYKDASGKTITANDIKNAGTYTVEVTFSHSDLNYNQIRETLTGTITIEKAVLSVKWTGQEVYDYNGGNPVSLKAEIFGIVNGESVPYTIYLNGNNAAAGSLLGSYTAKVVLGDSAINYTFAGGKNEVTYSYEIKNLSTEITKIDVTFSQSGITLKNTDEVSKVLSGISKVTVTYSNGYSEDLLSGYTVAGDFGAANPYFIVCCGGAKSADISVTLSEVITLSSVRVEEVENVSAGITVGELKDLLEVTATYANGTSKALDSVAFKLFENGAELSDEDALAEGKHTITVSYTQGAVTATDDVEVTAEGVTLSKITATLAEGTKIYAGTTEEELKSALTVTAVYSDGSEAPAVGYTLEYEPFTAGEGYQITVKYNGKTAVISGAVEADETVTVTVEWLGGGQTASGIPPVYEYTDIDELRNYIAVKANGEEVSGYLLSGTLQADKTCAITVTYANQTATLNVSVAATPSNVEYKGERATFSQGNTVIFANTSLEALKDLLKVEELYDEDGVEIVKAITDYTITGTLAGGQNCTLTASWGDKSAIFTVYVTAVAIESVTVEWKDGAQPVIYNTDTLGDIKSLITVSALNNDGTDYGAISADDITLSGTLSAGRCDITVTVGGKSVILSVNVTAVQLTGLSVKWIGGSQGVKVYASTNPEDIKAYIEVKALYNNNAEGVVLSADEYEISANFTLGDSASPVTVTFNNVSDGTLTVKVEGSELTSITAVYSQGNSVVYSSAELDSLKENLVVTAKFSGASDEVLGNNEYTLSGDLTRGACVITVTYNGKTATFTVNVTEVALASISATFNGADTVYASWDLDALKAYLTVTAVYGDNSSKTVTAESYTLSGDLSKSGTVTVNYLGKTAAFTVNVQSVMVETIAVSYNNGEEVYATASLDELKKFITVTATYNDKSSAEVTSYTLSGKLTAGKTCTITVTYDGKTATFDVAVAEEPLTTLTAVWKSSQPTVYPYTDIEDLRSYIKVTANGAEVEGYTLTGDLKSPSATVTVSYGGKTAILSVTVTSVPEENDITLSAAFAQGNVKIFEGANLGVLEGYLTVTATYGEESKTVQAGSYTLSGALTAGTSTITVTYEGKTATFTVQVSKIELAYITATFNQSGEVKVSAELSSLTVLTVTAYYTDGTSKTVTNYTLSGDLEAGKECEVTVTYEGKTDKFTVSVSSEPVTYTISAAYTANGKVYASTNVEDLRSAITVTAHYSDGTEKTVEGYKFVTESLTEGSCTVYVMYGSETAHVVVTVLAVEIDSISAGFNPTNTIYTSTALDDLAQYLTVTAVNNDGTAAGEIALTAGSYKLEGELKSGKQTITLTILGGKGAGKTATFEVEVVGVKVTSLTVSPANAASEDIYSTSDIGELKNIITVTANYNDGSKKTLLADDYTLAGSLTAGETCTLTVTYNGVSGEFTVKVEEEVLTRIEVTYNQTSAVYSSDTVEGLTSKGTLKVTAYYNGGNSSMAVEDGYTLSGQLTSGNCLITVSYGGLTDTFEVTVTAVTLVSVKATLNGGAPELFTTTAISTVKQFITVTAEYSNGESKTLSAEDYEISNGALTAGDCVLSISYDGKSCALTLPVTAVKLEGISVEHTTLPAIFANYDIQELKTHLTVTAVYTDGKMTEVTEYEISASLVAGEICTVTVSYGGQTASFDIEVQAKSLKEISAVYNGGEVDASASLEDVAKNVSVTAYYTDGTSQTVSTGFTLSGDLSSPTATLTVTYGGKTDSITVPVSNAVKLTHITAELSGNATIYSSANVQNLKNVITVTAHYDNGETKVIPADGYTLAGTLNANGGVSTLTVTLNSDGAMTAEIEINVVKVELESITVEYTGGSLLVSDKLENISGLSVKGINNDGTSFDILDGCTLAGDLTAGECEIAVTYNGKTATFKVNVTDETESGTKITVTGLAASWTSEQPVFYATSDAEVLKGYAEAVKNYIEVTATYSDGASKPVTGYTVEGVTLNGNGTARVALGYAGYNGTAYIDITLTAVELDEIFADFDCGGKVIYVSDSLGTLTQYLKVTGLNNDGSPYLGGSAIPSNAYTLSGELTAGKCEITVTYNGKTASFTVEVTAVKVTSLTVTPSADLPEVYTTSSLDALKQYLEVSANYNDGRPASAVASADYTLSGELLAGRECEITVTYNGAVGTFKVTVKSSVLSKITAEYDADKTAPVIYSSTDINTLKDYLKVTASFTGGEEDRVLNKDEYTLTGGLTKDACQITVVFNGKTAYFLVNVTEVALITLSAEFNGANAPEVFSTSSLEDLRDYITVTAYYSDGNHKVITNYTFASVKLTEGENTVTVNYGVDYSASFTLNVTGVKLGGISAEFDVANAPKIFANTLPESLKEWLTVTAEYTDGKTAEVYDYTVTGVLEAGKTCTLTVSYGGKSATFDVTVEKKSIDRIQVNYGGAGAVEVTATLDGLAKNVTVTVYYGDGTYETVTSGFTVEGSVIPGSNRVFTVYYAGESGTFTVTVNNTYTLSKITAVFEQGNTRVYAGKTSVETLKNMLTVTAHYVDALGYSAGTRVLDGGEYEIVGNIDVAGSVSLKVTFSQREAQFTVTVTGRELDSITPVFNAGTVKITASTPFAELAKYLTVTGLYNDGTQYNNGNPIPSNEYTVTGDLIAGKVCTLTVKCGNVSATFDVAVDAGVTLTGVTVTFDQTDVGTVYSSSDASALAKGLVVTATYSDGSTRVIAYPNYTVECDIANGGVNPAIYVVYAPYGTQKITAAGTLTVTPVKVNTISASFNQNGKPITSATAETLEQMIADGGVFLTVVGVNNDGTFAGVLTGYTLSYDFATSGEVEVDYNGIKTSFAVIVLNRELASISVSYSGGAVIFENESMELLKDKLTVQAIYTSGSPDTLANDDYTLTYTEVSRDSEKVGYTVTVEYFDKKYELSVPVYVTLLKLNKVSAELDPAYASEVVIYDSMSAQQAAELVENYLTLTGLYNDNKTETALSLSEFTVTGDLSSSSDGKVRLTLTYDADNALFCIVEVEVTKVALAGIEVTYLLQHTTAVYTTNTLADLENLLATNKILLDITANFNNGATRVLSFGDYTISADASEFNEDGETFKQGQRTITVTYVHGSKTETCTFEIKVSPVNVESLEATIISGNTVYTTTTLEEFYSMLSVVAKDSDGKIYFPSKDDYSLDISGDKPFLNYGESGEITVTVTYGGKTKELTVSVSKTVLTIDVSGMAEYDFDPSLTTQKIESGAKLMLGGAEVTGLTLSYSHAAFSSLSDLALNSDNKRTIEVTVSFAGDGVYAAVSERVTVIVNKAQVDMSGYGFLLNGEQFTDGTEVTYDPDKTYTLELDSDGKPSAITNVTYKIELSYNGTSATVSSIHDSGTYTVTATFTVSGDYEVPDPVSVTFVINKAQAELDFDGVDRVFTYTGEEQTYTGVGIKTGSQTASDISYTVNGVPCVGGYSFTNVADGNGVIVTVTVAENRNYLGDSVDVALIVNKVALTVTANPKEITYGDNPANDGVTAEGLIDGETLESLGVTFEYSYNYEGTGGKLGDYGEYSIELKITAGGLGNYNVTLISGVLTVKQKTVQISWSLTDVTYDGKDHAPMATYVNVYGVTVVPSVTLADGTASLTDGKAVNAGTYAATAVRTDTNYVFVGGEYEFEIKKADFSVTKSGDSWFAAGLDFDIDKLVTLDTVENGEYIYIGFVGSADVEILFSRNAYVKGTSIPSPEDDSTVTFSYKPQNVSAAGSYVINFRIKDKNGNHNDYNGQWSLDILDEADPDTKFVQIIFTKAYSFEYGLVPESEAELKALAEKLWDEGYIDTSSLRLEKSVFLDNAHLVLKVDNRTLANKDTGYGYYTIYFEWNEGSAYEDWLILYKKDNTQSDSNAGKLEILKKKLTAVWSETSFVADGTVHLPSLTISGFNDGSVYELTLANANGGTFTVEKDGRTLTLTVSVNGDLTAAGAHVITLTLDNINFEIEGGVTAISITAPAVVPTEPADEGGLSPLMIGIIAAVAVLAVLLIIVIIVVIKRKPSVINTGSDDGFDDYIDE